MQIKESEKDKKRDTKYTLSTKALFIYSSIALQ
jgi:hypothetical protein